MRPRDDDDTPAPDVLSRFELPVLLILFAIGLGFATCQNGPDAAQAKPHLDRQNEQIVPLTQ